MAELLFALPADLAQTLDREARRHGHTVLAHCIGSLQLREALKEFNAVAALVVAEALDAELLAAADATGVRLVALTSSRAESRRAADLGLLETIDRDAPWPELEALLLGAARSAASAGERRGEVIAVWGPSGAPGRTTVAITLAAEFAASGERVLLVDADTHGASIGPALGLPDESPGFAAACRLAAADGLTPVELERIAERASGGFHVLTGLGRPSRWSELSAERVEATLQACRAAADVVIVDVAASLESAGSRNASTLTTLAAADRVVAVGSADPVGLSRFLRAYPDLGEATTSPVTVVMNRLRATAIGPGPREQVSQALVRFAGIRNAVLVPDDRPAFDAAVLIGRTVTETMPKSLARAALRELAGKLLPAAPRRDVGCRPHPIPLTDVDPQ